MNNVGFRRKTLKKACSPNLWHVKMLSKGRSNITHQDMTSWVNVHTEPAFSAITVLNLLWMEAYVYRMICRITSIISVVSVLAHVNIHKTYLGETLLQISFSSSAHIRLGPSLSYPLKSILNHSMPLQFDPNVVNTHASS